MTRHKFPRQFPIVPDLGNSSGIVNFAPSLKPWELLGTGYVLRLQKVPLTRHFIRSQIQGTVRELFPQ